MDRGPDIIPGKWINIWGTEGDPDIYWGVVISPPRVSYKCWISHPSCTEPIQTWLLAADRPVLKILD